MDSASLRRQAEDIAALYEPPPTGRWSEVGDESTLRTLLEAAQDGLKDSDAALAAGINPETFRLWRQRAEAQPASAYAALFDALKEAKARGKHWHLRNIKRHSQKEWTASAWTLERTDPEQFGKRADDSQAPKVVVQIGVQQGDVQVSLQAQPAVNVMANYQTQTESEGLTGQSVAGTLPASFAGESEGRRSDG